MPWKNTIIAHHWHGYNDPLDVIWVCQSCNVILGGITGFTIEDATKYVKLRREKAEISRMPLYRREELGITRDTYRGIVESIEGMEGRWGDQI